MTALTKLKLTHYPMSDTLHIKQNRKNLKYIVESRLHIYCVRNIEILPIDGRIKCEINQVTAWVPHIFSPAVKVFDKESDAMKWVIDECEETIRTTRSALYRAEDREADELAEEQP